MFGIEAIDIKKIVLHKIDYLNDRVVLSDKYESLGQNFCDYFSAHIRNITGASNAKTGRFASGQCTVASCVEKVIDHAEDLLENSKIIAYWFFDIFRKDKANECFLAFAEFIDAETNKRYVAVFRFDMQKNYVIGKDGAVEQILTFPGISKPVNRAVIARVYDPQNKYDFIYRNQSEGRGEDPDICRSFMEDFLEAEDVPSPKFLTALVLKETEKWAEKNSEVLSDEEPAKLLEKVKNLCRTDEVDIAEAAQDALLEDDMKIRYINNLLDKGLTETVFVPDKDYAEKAAKKVTYICDYNIKITGDSKSVDEVMSFEKKDGKTLVSLKTGKFFRK